MKIVLLLLLALFALASQAQESTTARQSDPVIPVIVMENVPLTDALNNLARQAGLNFILDPRVAAFGRNSVVTKRWEKVTAQKALDDLLADKSLKLVANPATTVSRIVFSDSAAKPAAPIATSNRTNDLMPLIVMDDVPIAVAIQNLARQAGVMAELDSQLNSSGSGIDGQPFTRMTVNLRWEKLTALQALNAILENYGLTLVDGPVASTKVITKAKPAAGK